MLNTMRSFAQSFVAKTLMALLVISFGVWGIGDALRSHGSSTLVTVGHDTISPQEFAGQRSSIRQAMASLNVSNINAMEIDNEILRRLIQTRLIRQWLHDAGLSVNRAVLATTIKQDMQFHDVSGKFDPKIFKENLAARHLSEPMYLLQLRDEVAGKTLQSSLNVDDLSMPPALEKMAIAAQTQTRDVLLISVPPAPIDASKITDVQLHAYYDAHAQDFMEPEHRTLEYVTLDKSDISALIDASITEAALKERYEENPKIAPSFEAAKPELLKELRSEARDHVLQTVSTEIEDAMAGGSSMGQALAKAGVKSQSKLLTNITGSQLATSQDEVLKNVSAKGFALNEGETSGLQATKDGRYFVVSVKQIVPAAPQAFAQVKDTVRSQVVKEQTISAQRDAIMKAKEELSNSKDIDKTLAELHLSARAINGVTHPKTGLDGKPLASGSDLPPALAQAVFERGVNGIAGPALLPNGNVALAIVKAQHQPTTTLSDKETASMEKQYQAALGEEATGATLNNLVKKYPVDLNQPMLDQITQSDAQR